MSGLAREIGARIAALMQARGETRKSFASKLGLGVDAVDKLRYGDSLKKVVDFMKIAKALETTPDFLCGLTSEAKSGMTGPTPDEVCAAIRGVLEQLGHDPHLAEIAARLAIETASMSRVVGEDRLTALRIEAKVRTAHAMQKEWVEQIAEAASRAQSWKSIRRLSALRNQKGQVRDLA